ncbi:MAG: beta-glucosidase [Candidatus Adiutrix sp.]|jgi:hypothetical protein|nr:beta-glucosidase [Candidatus Adiutrix sp.]
MNFRRLNSAVFPGLALVLAAVLAWPPAAAGDDSRRDREALDQLQREAVLYMWAGADPHSGLAYEADFGWETRPAAVGGTGFGVAALVVGVDRGWIGRDQAVGRLLKITRFFRQNSRPEWRGAFPHWLDGRTGAVFDFGDGEDTIDLVETSLLMQGLLIARSYFNGPGAEAELRGLITELWEAVDWNWFTAGQESGLFWHWSPKRGHLGLKIKGYNEALITYVLALASPTRPISRRAYDYWTSGTYYRPRTVSGYRLEAAPPGGGPLFLAHYSFIGLDPRRLADDWVTRGYFVRGLTQTLANRAYCLQSAPADRRYNEGFWGLTASQIRDGGYAVSSPVNDLGVVAPTAALSSLPYTPHYSLEVLHYLRGRLKDRVWGPYGPRDAVSLKDDWVSPHYLAIDQLPMALMAENYRSGLLWRLFMADPDVRAGLARAGLREPALEEGFPEAVVTLKKAGSRYEPDSYEIRRHPDQGRYLVPYWSAAAGPVAFTLTDREAPDGPPLLKMTAQASKGRNILVFPDFEPPGEARLLDLALTTAEGREYHLPLRLH